MSWKLIINADDLGYDPAVSRGILEAMRGGIVSSATLMVNGPHSAAAAKAAGRLSIGLHLNLARWAPLSPALARRGDFDESKAGELSGDEVEAETLAQLDRLAELIGRPATHIDVHKHLHRFGPVLAGLARAAKARGLPVRSIDPGMRQALASRGVATNDHFIGDAGADAYWTMARLREQLEALPPGQITELMCHPGYAPTAVKSGYAAQREVELATFTHSGARTLIDRMGVELVDFRAVRPAHGPH